MDNQNSSPHKENIPSRVEELIQYFNNAYGIEKEWPKTFEVSPELYGRVCQYIIDYYFDNADKEEFGIFRWETISVGPNKGIIFKNVELIIKKEK